MNDSTSSKDKLRPNGRKGRSDRIGEAIRIVKNKVHKGLGEDIEFRTI